MGDSKPEPGSFSGSINPSRSSVSAVTCAPEQLRRLGSLESHLQTLRSWLAEAFAFQPWQVRASLLLLLSTCEE